MSDDEKRVSVVVLSERQLGQRVRRTNFRRGAEIDTGEQRLTSVVDEQPRSNRTVSIRQ